MAPKNRPSFPKMVGRALRRRCPWCGGKGAWFAGWFKKEPRCRTCGLKWDRNQEGMELGAMMIAVLFTGGSLLAWVIAGMIATAPDFPVLQLVLVGVGLAIVVPIVTYPFTYTLWSAFDLAVHPPEPKELAAAAEHRRSTS